MAKERALVPERSSGPVVVTSRWLRSVCQEAARKRRHYLRFRIKFYCCCAGIVPMMIPYYCAFGLELDRHVGMFQGPELAERVGRRLVAKWTKFGLKPEMLKELVYRLTNHRLDAETA